MKRHELKTWRHCFQALWDGSKTFEWRRDDRGFCAGDLLELYEYDPSGFVNNGTIATNLSGRETGRAILALVTFVLRGEFELPAGYCVMSVREVHRTEKRKIGWADERKWTTTKGPSK